MFTDTQRRIFGPYFDGTAPVYADPLLVFRRLQHHTGGKLSNLVEEHNGAEPAKKFEARNRLLAAAVSALELRAFDKKTGEGLLEEQVFSVLAGYLNWLSEKKANGPTTRT